jgi:hypothetical protein
LTRRNRCKVLRLIDVLPSQVLWVGLLSLLTS